MDLTSYPIEYIIPVQLEDNTLIQLRPIHPLDSLKADQFKSSLSNESLYARFHGYIPPVNEKFVKNLTEIDYSREMAIVAEVRNASQKEIIGIARIIEDEAKRAEFALIISDEWQGRRLGTIMTNYMLEVAKKMGFEQLYAQVQNKNTQMLEILRHLGSEFELQESGTVQANLTL